MKYMLDSDICIYIIKRKPKNVLIKLKECRQDGLTISAITLAEMEHGVSNSEYPEKNRQALAQFLSIIDVLPFDSDAAFEYGKIHTTLQKKGQLIGPLDMLIAAHAVSRGLIIVTNNDGEFGRIEDLMVENWL